MEHINLMVFGAGVYLLAGYIVQHMLLIADIDMEGEGDLFGALIDMAMRLGFTLLWPLFALHWLAEVFVAQGPHDD